MEDIKKCKIVQDLLPNYVEGLTNEETNKFIEEHLKTCKECNEIFENMKKSIEVDSKKIDKNEVKFFKKFNKKMKFLKAIILIILLIVVFTIGRKMIIIMMLSNRVEKYKTIDNFYIKAYDYQGDSVNVVENYCLEDTKLLRLTVISNEQKRILTNYYKGDSRTTFIESDGDKIAIINSNGLPSPMEIINWCEYRNVLELLRKATFSSIVKEVCNGKECYRISNLYPIDMLVGEGGAIVYIEIETGLPVRLFNGTLTYENGNKINVVRDYFYEFNSLTKNDIKIPNIEEYRIEE